jgi:hypothetical protein
VTCVARALEPTYQPRARGSPRRRDGPAQSRTIARVLDEERPTTQRSPANVATIVVACVWLAATAIALAFVHRFGNAEPFQDDLSITPYITGARPVTLRWLWGVYNDHRLPIPKAVAVLSMRAAHGDYRFGLYLNVALLASIALASILALRRARGSTSILDAIFPLQWLHLGHCFNLLMAFQLTVILPPILGAAALCVVATQGNKPSRRAAAMIAVCVIAPMLCSAGGPAQAPALIAWSCYAGWTAWARGDRGSRRDAYAMWAASVAGVCVLAAYFVKFDHLVTVTGPRELGDILRTSGQFASQAIGPGASEHWPFSIAFVAALTAATVARLIVVFATRPDERVRASGVAACLGSIATLAIGLGWGRAGTNPMAGFAYQYVTLTAGLAGCVVLTWSLYGPRVVGTIVNTSLLVVLAAMYVDSARAGIAYGEQRAELHERLMRDVRAGATSTELAARHGLDMFPDEHYVGWLLSQLRAERMPPFAESEIDPDIDRDRVGPFKSFQSQPLRGAPTNRIVPRMVDDREVAVVPAQSTLVFALPASARSLRGHFGLLSPARRAAIGVKAHFEVTLVAENGAARTIFERTLEPSERTDDARAQEVALDLPQHAAATLELRVSSVRADEQDGGRCYWADIVIQ